MTTKVFQSEVGQIYHSDTGPEVSAPRMRPRLTGISQQVRQDFVLHAVGEVFVPGPNNLTDIQIAQPHSVVVQWLAEK